MRIGDTVVRVSGEFNLRKVGDIAVIDGLKIYNNGVSLHLEGDKSGTFHSMSNYRLVDDVDMPCLAEKLSHVKRSINAFNGDIRKVLKERAAIGQMTKKRNKLIKQEFIEEPEDDEPFDFPEGTFTKSQNLLL